ncbi:hypothetical protein PENTCL1PPCAC_5325, partial [Pristionchus entomophagus]
KRDLIVALLRENGLEISNDADFAFTRVGEGKGFVSMIYKISLGEASYVIKITNPHGKEEAPLNVHENLHNREVDLYRWASDLPEKYRNDFKLPKFFGGRHCNGDQEGIIILEDFSDRMINDIDWISGISVDLVEEIIRSIASYQSYHLHCENKFPTSDKSAIYRSLNIIHRTHTESLPKKPWITEARKRAMLDFNENIGMLTEEYPDFAKNAPRTLIHCDMWPPNMLYERIGANVRLLSIIDWQCATLGNALFDVSTLCGMSLTAEVRRANEQGLVEFYWSEMQQKCAQLGTSFGIDLETTHLLYRHCLQSSALELASMVVLMKADDIPKGNSIDGPISARLRALLEDLE